MRKFNLLHELNNIRNTITPDTPLPGERAPVGGKRGLLLGLFLVAVLAVGGALWSQKSQTDAPRMADTGPDESSPAPAADSLLADDGSGLARDERSPLLADANTPAPDEVEPVKKPSSAGPHPKRMAAVPSTKPPGYEPAQEPIKPIMSRPVAKGAAPAKKPPAIARRKAKTGGKGDVWSVRFALCVMKRSCEEIVGKLKQ